MFNIESAKKYSETLQQLFVDHPEYYNMKLSSEVDCPICGRETTLMKVVKNDCEMCKIIDSEKHDWEDSV